MTAKAQDHIVYVTSFSYDWEEGTHVFRTIEEAYAQWHRDMGLDDEDDCPKPGTEEWRRALVAAYESDDWKAYNIRKVDAFAATFEKLDPYIEMDWEKVIELVGWSEPEPDEDEDGEEEGGSDAADFRFFCEGATDHQLVEIEARERRAGRHAYAEIAGLVARARQGR